MDITRRRLLSTAAVSPLVLVLADCGASPPSPGPGPTPAPQWVTILETIGSVIKQAGPELAALGLNLNQPVGSTGLTVSTILTDIENVASGIGAFSTPAQGQSALTTIENDINNVAGIIAPFAALVPGYGSVISLAIAALPLVEGLLNGGISLLTPAAKALAAKAPAVAMTPGRMGAAPAAPMSPEQALAMLQRRR